MLHVFQFSFLRQSCFGGWSGLTMSRICIGLFYVKVGYAHDFVFCKYKCTLAYLLWTLDEDDPSA